MSYSKKSFGPDKGKPVVKPPLVFDEVAQVTAEQYEAVVGGFTPRTELTVVSPAEFAAGSTEKHGAEKAEELVQSALRALEAGEKVLEGDSPNTQDN